MVSVRVFVLVILAVKGLDHVRAYHTWNNPISFTYNKNDYLDIYIVLKNRPPDAYEYALNYQMAQPAGSDMIPVDNIIPFVKLMNEKSARLDIHLLRGNRSWCSTKLIMFGEEESHRVEAPNVFHTQCLNKHKTCKIVADFGNKCEETTTPTRIECKQDYEHLTCESPNNLQLPENTVHQWYQQYSDSSFIGSVPKITGIKSRYNIKLQQFDLNTRIYSTIKLKRRINSTPEYFWIEQPRQFENYGTAFKRTYSESAQVTFKCAKYATNNAHTQIGWIDPTGYRITTYNKTSVSLRFSKSNNGWMLCCLYYNIYKVETTLVVERSVEDITVLIHKEPETQENAKERPPARIVCEKNQRSGPKTVTCDSSITESSNDTIHQWYQRYNDGSYIGTIPTVKGEASKFKVKFHKFDLGTYIFGQFYSKLRNMNLTTNQHKITFKEHENYKKYDNDLRYSDSAQVTFNCASNNAHAQMGRIDQTGYRITTYNKTSHSWRFRKSDNGSMLCCIYYNTYTLEQTEVVERLVENITVLIFIEPKNQDNAKDSGWSEESTTSSTTTSSMMPPDITDPVRAGTAQTASSIGSPPQPNLNQGTSQSTSVQDQTSTEKPHNIMNKTEPPSTLDDPQNKDHLTDSPYPSDKTNYYIAIAAVAVIVLVISVIYVIVKKCSRKTLDPEQALELETYASANMVYAELDIKPGNQAPAPTTEDTTYAEIIGVLKPINEHVKK